jgi:beta-glucanase (GH16 family)
VPPGACPGATFDFVQGKFPGGYRSRVTPVPIPNTEVKPATADGTAWVTAWESRSLPGLFSTKARVGNHAGLFFVRFCAITAGMPVRHAPLLGALAGAFLLPLIPLQALNRPAPQAVPPGYSLVWHDEFDRDGRPDPALWTYEHGFVRNQESQWYQPENVIVAGGLLVIEARRERQANPDYQPGSTDWKRNRQFAEYTSASVTTKRLHEWKYGRFEMRGRIDTRDGLWPAFWTVGSTGSWPRNGEIDIMEFYRGLLLANVAWGSAESGRAVWAATRKPLTTFADPDWSSKFHVWRMDWDEHWIRLYVDDALLNEVDLTRTINDDGTGVNPFHAPQQIILNLAIGGTSGGDPSHTDFPAKFEIDYVRIFQKVP